MGIDIISVGFELFLVAAAAVIVKAEMKKGKEKAIELLAAAFTWSCMIVFVLVLMQIVAAAGIVSNHDPSLTPLETVGIVSGSVLIAKVLGSAMRKIISDRYS